MQENRYSRLIIRRILSFLIKCFFCVNKTLRFQNSIEFEKPCLAIFFHDEIMPIIEFFKHTNTVALASKNHAGAAIGKVLHNYGYEVVYGSSARDGIDALRKLGVKLKENKKIFITPDGPTGPRHKIKPGAIILAKRENVPLYLLSPNYKGIKIKFLWDSFLYPLPFTKVTFKHIKKQINYKNAKERDALVLDIENQLQYISNS